MSYATVEQVRAILQSDSEDDKQIEQMMSDADFATHIPRPEPTKWTLVRTLHE